MIVFLFFLGVHFDYNSCNSREFINTNKHIKLCTWSLLNINQQKKYKYKMLGIAGASKTCPLFISWMRERERELT